MHNFNSDFLFEKIFRKKKSHRNISNKIATSPPKASRKNNTSMSRNPTTKAFNLAHRTKKEHLSRNLVEPLKTDVQAPQARSAYRIDTSLKTEFIWRDTKTQTTNGLITNLSGGGFQALLPELPKSSRLNISLKIPQAFVHSWLRSAPALDSKDYKSWDIQRQRVNDLFEYISGQIVFAGSTLNKDPFLFHICVSFNQPHEGCYRLVRYLERRTIQHGPKPQKRSIPVAA